MEEQEGALLVVAEGYVRYKAPAHYEDILTIRTQVSEIRSRSIRFNYEIVRKSDDTLIAEGETLHLVTDKSKKVRTLPEIYRLRLAGEDKKSFPANQAPS
jgi:acyl-CoA thioester hydrolase